MNSRAFLFTVAIIAGLAGVWFAQKTLKPEKVVEANTVVKTAAAKTNAVANKTPTSVPAKAEARSYISYKEIKLGKKPMRPLFRMPDSNEKVRHIKEWHGKIILLNFWATWCPPCRKEMPAFIELQKKYQSQGLQIIGVAVDDVESVNKFAKKIGVNYPLLVGSMEASELSRVYGNAGGQLPYTVFINRQGQLVAVKRGELSKELAEKINQKLLKKK